MRSGLADGAAGFPVVTRSTIDERWRRTRAAMTEARFDALLVLAGTNLVYLTGYERVESSLARPFFLLLPRAGEPAMLVHDARRPDVLAHSWVRDVRAYTQLSIAPIAELRALLLEHGLSRGRVGMELGFEQLLGLPMLEFERLRAELSPLRLVDASRLLWGLRMIKSPADVDSMRWAGQVTADAYEETFSSVAAGMRERDVRAAMSLAQIRRGASAEWGAITSGAGQYDIVLGPGTERSLEPGDMVWMDAGCQIGGMWSDYSRGGVIGGSSPDQEDAQRIVEQITTEGIELVRPGVPVAEIAQLCDERVGAVGLHLTSNISGLAGRVGHGIGLDVTEPPHVSQQDPTVLEPGMVISIEPGFATEFGVFHVEENVLVTEDGHEILSVAPRGLRALGQPV